MIGAGRAAVEVSVVGSFVGRSIPDELSALYSGTTLVDPRNGTPMEMDAYSVYLALKALERTRDLDFHADKFAIVKALLGRMHSCKTVWSHGAWTRSPQEIHMRFTAAAVRLLVEALDDTLINDPEIVSWALKHHLRYAEPLDAGLWFLHDTFEMMDGALPHPQKPQPNRVWGSGPRNCLVLNTHVDTLSTILDVLRRVPLRQEDHEYFSVQLHAGLAALEMVLAPNDTASWRAFALFDSLMREMLFSTFDGVRGTIRHRMAKGLRRAIIEGYFPLRRRLRCAVPGFAFPDGYLERDISLKGRGFEYHIVNAFDLVRLMLQLRNGFTSQSAAVEAVCGRLVDAAIDYALGSNYWRFQIASMRESTRAILLCETIVARIGSMASPSAPAHWVSAYCAIRRALPPSAAILGYDPFIVDANVPSFAPPENCDVFRLHNGTTLSINLGSEEAVLAVSERPLTVRDALRAAS